MSVDRIDVQMPDGTMRYFLPEDPAFAVIEHLGNVITELQKALRRALPVPAVDPGLAVTVDDLNPDGAA